MFRLSESEILFSNAARQRLPMRESIIFPFRQAIKREKENIQTKKTFWSRLSGEIKTCDAIRFNYLLKLFPIQQPMGNITFSFYLLPSCRQLFLFNLKKHLKPTRLMW